MGVLSDLVSAPHDQADQMARSLVPARDFDGTDVKGIDSIKLCTLHSLLTDEPLDALFQEYDPVVTVSGEGPWVFLLPQRFVEKLCSATDSERERIAMLWSETEEFELDGWPPDAVVDVLKQITAMACRAVARSERLFLRMSL